MRSLVEQNPSCACPLASTVAQPSVANSRFRKQASSSRRSVKIGSGMNFSQAVLPQRPSDSSQRVSRLRSLFRIAGSPPGVSSSSSRSSSTQRFWKAAGRGAACPAHQ